MRTDPEKPQPTLKDLAYPDIEDYDVHGLRLADLDPDSERESERCEESPHHEGPAEGPDIG